MLPPQASLEGVPAEIRRYMLYSISDIDSLRCLVQASPLYYALYSLERENIWNIVTFRILESRGIEIPNEPADCVQISAPGCTMDPGVNDELQKVSEVLQTCYHAWHEKRNNLLDVSQCKNLLGMNDLVSWRAQRLPDG